MEKEIILMDRKIKELLNYGASLLEENKSLTTRLDAEVLMAFLLNKERSFLFMYPDKELDDSTIKAYLSLINERKNGKPIAYITNHQEFMGIDFYVNEHVLIPRPDTEILVESILKTLNKESPLNILDLGCGSGAIAVSLAYYLPKAFIYGVDIQQDALLISEKNAKKQGLDYRLKFISGNLFEPLSHNIKFDVIVSNPPYIPTQEIEKLQVEVSNYEPRAALDGGIDGLDFYRKIISEAPKYIKDGGYLFLEIGYDQASDISDLMSENKSYTETEVIKDLAGLDRVIKSRIDVI